MITPRILWEGNLQEESITLKLTTGLDQFLEPEVKRKVDKLWRHDYKQAKNEGKLIFDGESYRLESFSFQHPNRLELQLGIFKFHDRYPLTELAVKGELDDVNESNYSKGLGIGGPVVTSDGFYVFGARSGKTMAKEKIDFIGGMLESSHMATGSDLFAVNYQELLEEAGIERTDVNSMSLRALVLSNTSNILLIMRTTLKLTHGELYDKFKLTPGFEMSDLIFWPDDKSLMEKIQALGGYKIALTRDILGKR